MGQVVLVNAIQLGMVIIAGYTWDRWFQAYSLFNLNEHLDFVTSAFITYIVVTFVYYWWHRIRHGSRLFWLLCHQLHHSPNRIEIATSFYKHPVEITLNSLLTSLIAYPLMGCSVKAAGLMTFLTAIAEYLYHWKHENSAMAGLFIPAPGIPQNSSHVSPPYPELRRSAGLGYAFWYLSRFARQGRHDKGSAPFPAHLHRLFQTLGLQPAKVTKESSLRYLGSLEVIGRRTHSYQGQS